MTCDDCRRLIDAYLDGELPVTETLATVEHIEHCEACRRVAASESSFHALLDTAIQGEELPSGLRERIDARIRVEAGGGGVPRRRWSRFALISAVASVAIAGLLAWFVVASIVPDRGTASAVELVNKHEAYTAASAAPLQLTTSDPARMSAWLASRLGFPVRLPPLGQRPERLIGGRVATIGENRVAYVRFDRAGEPLSLFVARRVRFAGRQFTEQHVNGVEIYVGSVRGVALAWWEEEGTDRVYAAASAGGTAHVVDLALLCTRSGRPQRATP